MSKLLQFPCGEVQAAGSATKFVSTGLILFKGSGSFGWGWYATNQAYGFCGRQPADFFTEMRNIIIVTPALRICFVHLLEFKEIFNAQMQCHKYRRQECCFNCAGFVDDRWQECALPAEIWRHLNYPDTGRLRLNASAGCDSSTSSHSTDNHLFSGKEIVHQNLLFLL